MSSREDIEFPSRLEDLISSSNSFAVDEAEVWQQGPQGVPLDLDSRLVLLSEQDEEEEDDSFSFFLNCILHLEDTSCTQRKLLNECLCNRAHHLLEVCQEEGSGSARGGEGAKMMFLLLHFCSRMEKVFKASPSSSSASATAKKRKTKSSPSSYVWPEWRSTSLALFHSLLDGRAKSLFAMGMIPENFLMMLWRYPLSLLEEKPVGIAGQGGAEQASKKQCISLLCQAGKHVSAGASTGVTMLVTALLESASRYEHLSSPLAELCRAAGALSPLVAEMMNEVGRLNMTDLCKGNTSAAKNVGCFLTAVASTCPEVITMYFPLLVHHLDSDVYQIRCAVITAMGSTIAFIHRQSQASIEKEGSAVGDDTEESSGFNIRQFVRLRDDMVDMLVERKHDVSSFVRSAVLRVWSNLVEEDALPLIRFGVVADVALNRLDDKIAAVRKNSVHLLTALLECNPFSGSLNISHFVTLRGELDLRIKERMALLAAEVMVEKEDIQQKTIKTEPIDEENVFGEDAPEDNDLSELYKEDVELVAMSAELSKCISCLELLQSIHTAVPKIGALLSSKTNSDVLEALKFFMRTVKFGVKGSASFLHQSFSLIWHHDDSVRMECLLTFFHVYLSEGGEGSQLSLLPSDEIAYNLIQLSLRCSLAELTSIEKLIGEIFVRASGDAVGEGAASQEAVFKKFHKQAPEVIQKLWLVATGASRKTPAEGSSDRHVALHGPLLVLKMIAAGQSTGKNAEMEGDLVFTADRIKALCKLVLGDNEGVTQPSQITNIRTAAMCLMTAPSYLGSIDEEERSVLVTASERLAQVVCDKYQKFDTEEMTRVWFGCCEEAVAAIFHLHPTPDVFLRELILSKYSAWASATSASASPVVVKTRLARFLFLCGQGALSLLLYTEKIANKAKKAVDIKHKEQRDNAKTSSDGNEVDDMEEEMGLTALADAEHEREFNAIVETELVVDPDNLLGKFHPLVAFVVANNGGEYSDPLVREAAVLSLCRYMSVSSVLCEQYLPLLFTVLERETCDNIRTSIIIATGDLSFRFPNCVEPWTARMYDRLTDDCLLVRYNTLMVLTHLILNDMIKVKGQVSAVVMCLNDSSEKVCSLARLFFTELSKRSNNPVYNLLGDIISSLSRDRGSSTSDKTDMVASDVVKVALVSGSEQRELRELTAKEFQTTMCFLLKFVTKDKQADSLMERLFVRILAAVSSRQRRHLAFCVSQLPITDKGVKRMIELVGQMKDILLDEEILSSLRLAVSKAKRTSSKATSINSEGEASKGSVKEIADEFENFVKSVVEGNGDKGIGDSENSLTLNTAGTGKTQLKKKGRKPTEKKAPTKKSSRKKKVVEESESSGEEDDDIFDKESSDEEDEVLSIKKESTKKKGGAAKTSTSKRGGARVSGMRC